MKTGLFFSKVRALALVICILFLQLSNAFAQKACVDVFKSSKASAIYNENDVIRTPESLPMLRESLEFLNTLIQDITTKKHPNTNDYLAILPEIQAIKNKGEAIVRAKALNQDEVFKYFHGFSVIVDYPLRADKNVSLITQQIHSPNYSLKSAFPNSMVGSLTMPNQNFAFQYKYVFKAGVLSLKELFQDRESGTVYVGVTKSSRNEVDGTNYSALNFLRHDMAHAFIQKYFDQWTFSGLKATTAEQRQKIKKISHELLQARIKEYESLKDTELRDAIEVFYFMILHERGRDYPYGTAVQLNVAKEFGDYLRLAKAYLHNYQMGPEYFHLYGTDVLPQALEWIKTRAMEDYRTLQSTYKTIP